MRRTSRLSVMDEWRPQSYQLHQPRLLHGPHQRRRPHRDFYHCGPQGIHRTINLIDRSRKRVPHLNEHGADSRVNILGVCDELGRLPLCDAGGEDSKLLTTIKSKHGVSVSRFAVERLHCRSLPALLCWWWSQSREQTEVHRMS